MTATPTRTGHFRRDRLTVSLYSAFVVWGWFLYAFTPAVPLIAVEQGVSLGVAGLHGTAMAVGAVLSGLTSPLITLRHGRWALHALGGGVGRCTLWAAPSWWPGSASSCSAPGSRPP
jgi:hypothetical protein